MFSGAPLNLSSQEDMQFSKGRQESDFFEKAILFIIVSVSPTDNWPCLARSNVLKRTGRNTKSPIN